MFAVASSTIIPKLSQAVSPPLNKTANRNDLPENIGRLAIDPKEHLWRHVLAVSLPFKPLFFCARPNTRHSEITNEQTTFVRHKNVRWLNVHVDVPALMDELETLRRNQFEWLSLWHLRLRRQHRKLSSTPEPPLADRRAARIRSRRLPSCPLHISWSE